MRKRISKYVLMCLFILLISNTAFCEEDSEHVLDGGVTTPVTPETPTNPSEGLTPEEKARQEEIQRQLDEKTQELQNQIEEMQQQNESDQNSKVQSKIESSRRQEEKEQPDTKIKEIPFSNGVNGDRGKGLTIPGDDFNELPKNHTKEYTKNNSENSKLAAILEYAVAKYAVAYESYNIAKQSEEPEVRKLIPKYLRSYREAAADLLTLLRDTELYEPQEPKNIAKKFNDQLRSEGKDAYETQQGSGLSSDKLEDIKEAMKQNNTTAVVDYVDRHYKNKNNEDYAKKMRKKDRNYNQDISEESMEGEGCSNCPDPEILYTNLKDRIFEITNFDIKVVTGMSSPEGFISTGVGYMTFEDMKSMYMQSNNMNRPEPINENDFDGACNMLKSKMFKYIKNLHNREYCTVPPPLPDAKCKCDSKPGKRCKCACCKFKPNNSTKNSSQDY